MSGVVRRGKVRLRRDLGLQVKPAAEQLEGMEFSWRFLWFLEEGERRYPGEAAWQAMEWANYPPDAPSWIATGDIEFSDEPGEKR